MDGGGVLIAVLRNIPSARVERWESNCEDLWVSVQTKIAICAVYLPSPVKSDTLTYFLDKVDNITNQPNNVLIMGNFNLGFINWSRDHIAQMVPSNYNSTLGCGLVDFMYLNNFSQFNNIPNSDARYLDLIMSNFPGVDVSEPLEL
ncbi:unnamed protein product [Parnassius apollo]|uniref:(apollo) hypothetical protein n=1 Tax=Parnassius apollo TaxID=110799 RepID=A0A8S3Y4J6_PARAO|nr:unnamed protein product [Parnassius apollo]